MRDIDRHLPEIGIQANTEKCVFFNKDNDIMEHYRATRNLTNVSCRFEDIKEPVLKINILHDNDEQILALASFLGHHPLAHHFSFVRSEKIIYEVLPKCVNKGAVLGIAVSNAVKEVKAVADYITVSNNEDAVSVIIDNMDREILKV